MHSPVCDSYVRPETLVRICDECNFGTYGGRCIICGSPGMFNATHTRIPLPYLFALSGISDAYYCAECTRLEKDRDGCPKIVNLGASRTDLFYERRRLGPPSRHLSVIGAYNHFQDSRRVDADGKVFCKGCSVHRYMNTLKFGKLIQRYTGYGMRGVGLSKSENCLEGTVSKLGEKNTRKSLLA